jgi:hypothetical protein
MASGWLLFSGLSQDDRLLFATRRVPTFAHGFLSLILGLYAASLGCDNTTFGGMSTAVRGPIVSQTTQAVEKPLSGRLVAVD